MTHPIQPPQTVPDAATSNPQNAADASGVSSSPFDNPFGDAAPSSDAGPSNAVANPFAENAEPVADSIPANPFAEAGTSAVAEAQPNTPENPFADGDTADTTEAQSTPTENPFAETDASAATEAQPTPSENPFAQADASADSNAQSAPPENPFGEPDAVSDNATSADEQPDAAIPTATGETANDANETVAVVEQAPRTKPDAPADADLMTTVWAILPWLALLPLLGLIYYTWRMIRGGDDYADYPRESSRRKSRRSVEPKSVSEETESELAIENELEDSEEFAFGDNLAEQSDSVDEGPMFANLAPVTDDSPLPATGFQAGEANITEGADIAVTMNIDDDSEDDFGASWIEEAETATGDDDSVKIVATGDEEDDSVKIVAADDGEDHLEDSDSVLPFSPVAAEAIEQNDDSAEGMFDDDDSAANLFDEDDSSESLFDDDDDIDLTSEWDDEVVSTSNDANAPVDFDAPLEPAPADHAPNLSFPGVDADIDHAEPAALSDGHHDDSPFTDTAAPIAALGAGIAAIAGLSSAAQQSDADVADEEETDNDPFDFSAELEDDSPLAATAPRLAEIHEETETEIELQRELERALARINEIESQHDQLQSDFNSLQGENTELTESVKNLNEKQDESAALTTDLDTLKEQLTEAQAEKQKLADDLELQQRELTDELDAKQQIIDATDADREELDQLRTEKSGRRDRQGERSRNRPARNRRTGNASRRIRIAPQ